MSTIEVNKITPVSGGTATTLGDSGDTFTVPTGAGLTVTDEVKTNKISPASGTTFTLGDSGDTFNIPSGATIANAGTATGFGGIDCDADAWARVAPTTDQDVAGVIDWATSIHMGSNISESGGVITVGTAGWYLVSIHISNQSAFTDNMSMQLRKNNSTQLGRIYWEGNTEINYMGMDGTVLVECAANDTLDVYGTGYYSGNTNSDSLTWFTGVRLGA